MHLASLSPSAADAPVAFGLAAVSRDPLRDATHLETARRFLAAIEQGATGDALAAFYDPEVEQVEFPNRLLPNGVTRGLPQLLEGADRGRQVLRRQRYEVRRAHVAGDTVVLEVLWIGTLAIAIGALAAGDEMRAHFCQVLDFRDGRIWRQRNYDCFEPF